MKIVLLGYMGSGKTTVGKKLAKDLSLRFLDLDDRIEASEKSKITNIFSKKGEIYFRRKEAEYLRNILTNDDDFVLSIGGGTPCYANNMEAISEATNRVVYLKLSIFSLVERLVKEKSERPMIASIPDEDLPEFIGKHLFERSFYYSQALHSISCDGKDIEAIVNEIKKMVS